MIARTIFPNKRSLITAFISKDTRVLDVGFRGQGVTESSTNWPHGMLIATGADVYGVDLEIDRSAFPDTKRYQEGSAESFSFPYVTFQKIFAGDVIEHLSNPGLFLEACKAHMDQDSMLILTTPNTFNLFNMAEKLTKDEPTVNSDHTMYLNHRTLRTLLEKSGLTLEQIHYIYSLEYTHPESWKKKLLNHAYKLLVGRYEKFAETLVVIARKV